MEQFRARAQNVLGRLIGVVLVGQACVLGADTIDSFHGQQGSAQGLVFEQKALNLIDGGPHDHLDNFQIANGELLNVIAMGALGAGGIRLLRRRRSARRSETEE